MRIEWSAGWIIACSKVWACFDNWPRYALSCTQTATQTRKHSWSHLKPQVQIKFKSYFQRMLNIYLKFCKCHKTEQMNLYEKIFRLFDIVYHPLHQFFYSFLKLTVSTEGNIENFRKITLKQANIYSSLWINNRGGSILFASKNYVA